jgi:hypothetical protein
MAGWLNNPLTAILGMGATFSGDVPAGARGKFQTGYSGGLVGAMPSASGVGGPAPAVGPLSEGKIDPARIRRLTAASGSAHGVDPALMRAIIAHESGGWNVVSRGGDIGLAQLKSSTAGMSREDLLDPVKNIDAEAALLARLRRQFPGLDEMIAGYNAGPGGVKRAKARAAKQGGDWRNYLPKGVNKAGEPYDARAYLDDVKSRMLDEGKSKIPEGASFRSVNAQQYLSGNATVFVDVRDKKTGESLAQTKVPLGPTAPISGLPTTSQHTVPGV